MSVHSLTNSVSFFHSVTVSPPLQPHWTCVAGTRFMCSMHLPFFGKTARIDQKQPSNQPYWEGKKKQLNWKRQCRTNMHVLLFINTAVSLFGLFSVSLVFLSTVLLLVYSAPTIDRCTQNARTCVHICSPDSMTLSPLTSHAIVDIFKRCTYTYEFSNEFLFCSVCFSFPVPTIGEVSFSFCHWNLLPNTRRFHLYDFSFALAINLWKGRKKGKKRKYSASAVNSCGSEILFLHSCSGNDSKRNRLTPYEHPLRKSKTLSQSELSISRSSFFLLFFSCRLFRRMTIIAVCAVVAHGLVGYIVA